MEIKVRFAVKDNYGNTFISVDYEWTPGDGLPCEEAILEDMEECTCTMNELVNHCEGECIRFDEGKVIDKLLFTGHKDKNRNDIYEGDIVKFYHGGVKYYMFGEVSYDTNEAKFKYCAKFKNGGTISCGLGYYLNKTNIDSNLEIIGNKYQNPGLLKEI